MNKIYFENTTYTVFLNRVNNIKIERKKDGKVFDYFNDIYADASHGLPKYVVNRCRELHTMSHNGTLNRWIAEHKAKQKEGKRA